MEFLSTTWYRTESMMSEVMKSRTGRTERIIFNGISYRRSPHSKYLSARTYFRADIDAYRAGYRYIHQDVWRFYRGDIPKGHHIHHKDENPANNNIENLECLSASDHGKKRKGKKVTAAQKAHLERILYLPSKWAWTRTEKGKDLNKKKWTEFLKPMIYNLVDTTCSFCSIEFKVSEMVKIRANNFNKNTFCSNNCKSAFRRKSGVDNATFKCQRCPKSFTANKYSKQKFCGRSCSSIVTRSHDKLKNKK